MIAEIAPLALRPLLLGTFGGVFGIAGVIGPLVGGTYILVRAAHWLTLNVQASSLTTFHGVGASMYVYCTICPSYQ